jgi:hypothetical protein
VRIEWWGAVLLPVLLACASPRAGVLPAPHATARARLAGCYVVRQRIPVAGDSLDADFPFVFGLDTVTLSRTGVPAYRVLLPPDDFTRWAEGWSWVPDGEGAEVEIVTPDAGYRLHLDADAGGWHGRLTAWNGAERIEYELSGPRIPCPSAMGRPRSVRRTIRGGRTSSLTPERTCLDPNAHRHSHPPVAGHRAPIRSSQYSPASANSWV